MRIYFIRHADPDYDNKTITDAGHREAEALSEKLKDLDINKIYCSPLDRAKDTMQYTADALNIEPVIEEWLQEVFEPLKMEETDWGTLAAWDIPGEEIRKNKTFLTHNDWEEHPVYKHKVDTIKKTYNKIIKKSDIFLQKLGYERKKGRYKIKEKNESQIAVFAHGGLGLCWLAHLLEIPLPLMWSGFWLAPSSVTTILFEERSSTWAVPRCIGMSDVSHLHKKGLKVKPRGIKGNFY